MVRQAKHKHETYLQNSALTNVIGQGNIFHAKQFPFAFKTLIIENNA